MLFSEGNLGSAFIKRKTKENNFLPIFILCWGISKVCCILPQTYHKGVDSWKSILINIYIVKLPCCGKGYTFKSMAKSVHVGDGCTSYLIYSIWIFHDKEIWHISVRLSDRFKVTQHKINFIKNCPQWDLNPQPSDHQAHALPNWAREESVEDFWSELSFVFMCHFTMLDFVYF